MELVQRGDVLRLKVQDWGTGFNPSEVEENRFGLAGMRERARLLGGTIRIESTPGEGTCITVELPLAMRGIVPFSRMIGQMGKNDRKPAAWACGCISI